MLFDVTYQKKNECNMPYCYLMRLIKCYLMCKHRCYFMLHTLINEI